MTGKSETFAFIAYMHRGGRKHDGLLVFCLVISSYTFQYKHDYQISLCIRVAMEGISTRLGIFGF